MRFFCFDERLYGIADDIAERHITRGWFETQTSVIVRKIRLRTAVYDELARASGIQGINAPRTALEKERP